MSRPGWMPRGSTIHAGLLGLLSLSCLPPASLPPPPDDPAMTPAPSSQADAGGCRVLVDTFEGGAPEVHELRWSRAGVEHRVGAGWVAGDGEQLFEIQPRTQAGAPSYMQAEAAEQAGAFACTTDQLMIRALPHGLAEPRIEARPACEGTLDGEHYQVAGDLTVRSILGPFLAWQERLEGRGPGPIHHDAVRTLDLRSGEAPTAAQWFTDPNSATTRVILGLQLEGDADAVAANHLDACAVRDGPSSVAALDGFAVVLTPAGPRLRGAWRCCVDVADHPSCHLDDPLPSPTPELAAFLPDPDGLLHGPGGCSLGLDGTLRFAGGEVIGEHGLDLDAMIGLVYLPADAGFELAWLEE